LEDEIRLLDDALDGFVDLDLKPLHFEIWKTAESQNKKLLLSKTNSTKNNDSKHVFIGPI
jgi:hypothetical protein